MISGRAELTLTPKPVTVDPTPYPSDPSAELSIQAYLRVDVTSRAFKEFNGFWLERCATLYRHVDARDRELQHQSCNIVIGSTLVCKFRDRDGVGAASRIGRVSKLPSFKPIRRFLREIRRHARVSFLMATRPRPLVFGALAVLDFTVQLRRFSRVLTNRGGCHYYRLSTVRPALFQTNLVKVS
jgi:hypothetical protein